MHHVVEYFGRNRGIVPMLILNSTNLIDMLLSSPGEAASIVAAEHQQWGMIGARVGRENCGRALRLVRVGAGADSVQYH